MKQALVVDLDGTLCDMSERLPLIVDPEKAKRDWDAFYAAMVNDKLNKWCHELITTYADKGVHIIYITGRPDKYQSQTMDWLRRNMCPINGLYMRPAKDSRKDTIVKKELFESYVKPKYEILFCIDDRTHLAQMWRSLGLVCLQCADDNVVGPLLDTTTC